MFRALVKQQQVRTVCEELVQHQDTTRHLYTSAPPYSDIINEDSTSDSYGDPSSLDLPRLVKHTPLDFTQLTDGLSKASVAFDLWQPCPDRNVTRAE